MVQNEIFACYDNFCGKKYGIEKEFIKKIVEDECKDLIFDTIFKPLDLRKIGTNCVIIFLTTTSAKEMIERIANRAPTSSEELKARQENMIEQIKNVSNCDYVVKTDESRNQEEILNELIYIINQTKKSYKNNGKIFSEELQKFTPECVLNPVSREKLIRLEDN